MCACVCVCKNISIYIDFNLNILSISTFKIKNRIKTHHILELGMILNMLSCNGLHSLPITKYIPSHPLEKAQPGWSYSYDMLLHSHWNPLHTQCGDILGQPGQLPLYNMKHRFISTTLHWLNEGPQMSIWSYRSYIYISYRTYQTQIHIYIQIYEKNS